MIRKLKDRFKRPSEPVIEPMPEPVKRSGIPSYARYHSHRRVESPEYDKTAEFLKKDPLADIPVGSLARPEGGLESPDWGVDDWLDGQYQTFPWGPEDDDFIINEARSPLA